MPPAPRNLKRGAVAAWCAFDWSTTPFHSVINTFVFAVWFSRAVYGDETAGSAAWAYAAGFAGLIVALVSPVCGAIADRTGRRKVWILPLTALSLTACAGLWFVMPEKSSVPLALGLVIAATIASELALVFYNAILPDIAAPERLGRVSGLGWGVGYLGGLSALILVLVFLIKPATPLFGLDHAAGAHIRITGPLVALWGAAFAWPLFLFVPDRPSTGICLAAAARQGVQQLRETLRHVGQYRTVMWFLIASALYRDGLNTLFAVGGLYAAHSFGMDESEILIFAIGINVTAVIGCFAFGWIDDRIGARRAVQLSLAGILCMGTVLLMLHDKAWFTPVALVMGLFIGPAQSSGRSLMARLAPREMVTEMFGLYQFAGKSVSFVGPLMFAFATDAFDSQRVGMATILLFIAAGLALMFKIRAE